MTQFFRSTSNPTALPPEKRGAATFPAQAGKNATGSNRDFPRKVKNFFRINSLSSSGGGHNNSGGGAAGGGGGGGSGGDGTATSKPETRSTFRQSRFLPSLGRHRSTTVASEGNPLDETLSPTALANPYFAHQGPPALRHHNAGSVPPSPPGSPEAHGANGDDASLSAEKKLGINKKDEMARKLRRVASAPNAQGLFANGDASDRPATASVGQDGGDSGEETAAPGMPDQPGGQPKPMPAADALSPPGMPRTHLAFRRTYSSNSIKVRNVEVGPSSFDKIKLIGKGDVGKVYLVREKKSGRLYAMKGRCAVLLDQLGTPGLDLLTRTAFSSQQERDDQAQQDQASVGRTGDPGHQQPSVHRHAVSLLPVGRSSLPVHGILQRRGVFSRSVASCAVDSLLSLLSLLSSIP